MLILISISLFLSIQCDEDGWALAVNDEPPYPTFFHQFSPNLIENLMIKGKIEISYVGFGSKGKHTEETRKDFIIL